MANYKDITRGLYNKYVVSKTSGDPVDDGAEYFLLRLDRDGDPEHVSASIKAILVYADAIQNYLPELARDIRLRYIANFEDQEKYLLDVKEGRLKWCPICMGMSSHKDGTCVECADGPEVRWVI